MKKIIFLTTVFLASGFLMVNQIDDSFAADKRINLSMGSTRSTSGVYAFAVGIAAAIAKHDPLIVNTVVESGGSYDNAKGMKRGVFDWSSSGSPAVYSNVYDGTGKFKKEGAWKDVRLMFLRSTNIARVYVREDKAKEAGIKTWSDLTGKSFAPGIPGTRDMARGLAVDKVLGTGVKFVPSSLKDAVRALKEGRVVGLLKGSPVDGFDAALLECHYSTPLTVIGFSKEDALKIQAADPMNTLIETAKGTIKILPQVGDFWEMNSSVMTMSSSRMPQEVAYRIVKAVHKGWDDIAEAYPPCKGVNPVADAIKATPADKKFLFHAGIIQYAKEIGIKVPKRLIPPEYKDVK